jgi:4-amino-4-deoxy-L-arabinose transferase-like glycosyltransferase
MSTMSTAGRRPHWRVVLAIVAVALVVLAHQGWWLSQERTEVVDIDEARYATAAVQAAESVRDLSLSGLEETYLRSTFPHAPLLSATSAPFNLLMGPGVRSSLLAQAVFAVVLTLATYAIARRLAPPLWAGLAGLAVVANPFVVDYSRSYQFALASAAMFTATLAAQFRSDRFRRWDWSIAWGLLLGATLLSRTMMVGLSPGLVMAALVAVWLAPNDRGRRLGRLAVGLLCMLVVAEPWYAANGSAVFQYLTGSGYGTESAAYGAEYSVLDPRLWLRVPRTLWRELPLLFSGVLVVGLAVAAWRAVVGVRARGWRGWIRLPALEVAGSLVIVLVVGYAVLTSSRNVGTGFTMPLLPALIVLAVAGLARLDRVPQRVAGGLLSLTLVATIIVKSGLVTSDATVVGIDPTSRIERYVEDGGYPDDADPNGAAARIVDEIIGRSGGEDPVVAFTPGDYLATAPLLELLSQTNHQRHLHLATVASPEALEGLPTPPRFLVIVHPPSGGPRLPDTADPDAVEQAAEDGGFELVETHDAPGGRRIALWERPA